MTGVAAGLLLHAGAAEAGVQMVKPEVKKVGTQLPSVEERPFPRYYLFLCHVTA